MAARLLIFATFLHAAPTTTIQIISFGIAAVMGSGGIFAFFKIRGEKQKLDAETRKLNQDIETAPMSLAQGAVIVQSSVIKDLQGDLKRQDDRILDLERLLEKRNQEIKSLEKRLRQMLNSIDDFRTDRRLLHQELQEYRDRIDNE